MATNPWQILIDTGGTFTDCIALSPDGKVVREKVLSIGSLRGTLLEKKDKGTFKFFHKWHLDRDIFKNYKFKVLGHNQKTFKILGIDFSNDTLEIDGDFELEGESDFEITAGEEAPVLATRLITQTALDEEFPAIKMRLGTTKGTNAMLENKGVDVTFLVTKGFRDLTVIGTQARPNIFQLNIRRPEQIYSSVIEVNERLDKDGSILIELSDDEVSSICQQLKALKTKVVAVALLHSYLNPVHENKLKKALQDSGIEFISLSNELSPSIKLLPRAKTALINAYLSPIIHDYIKNITDTTAGSDFRMHIMTSSGGIVHSSHFNPKDSLLSGPAGGVVGAAKISKLLGMPKILTLDMGGTSTDCARFYKHYDYDYITVINEMEMSSPCLSIETVAAGGGSVCYFDGFKLCVGPESAGASPGPACYGAGGPLTVTDVNLLLGKLAPKVMAIPINREHAWDALKTIKQQILDSTGQDYDLEDLLRGFETIANEKMADAIRKISVTKGFDPKDYALLSFGGAGGLHACKVAELLGILRIILPYDGGLLSAYGIGQAEIEKISIKQILQSLSDVQPRLPELIAELREELYVEFEKEGISREELYLKNTQVFLRCVGQDYNLAIPLEEISMLEPDFVKEYTRVFGHYPQDAVVEVESIKIIVAKDDGEKDDRSYDAPSSKTIEADEVLYWDELEVGDTAYGPFSLLNQTSTAFVEEGWRLDVSIDKNVILTKVTNSFVDEVDSPKGEAIELELFKNRFFAIADEMSAQLQRTSFSVNIKERLDFSCAILDADAELLVNAPNVPVHLGSLGVCARLVKDKVKLEKGDVVITNHPKYGGSHLPDVTLISPVFSQQDELIAYVINRTHHAEIGGKAPGSMPFDAENLEQEGVVIPPTYLMKNGISCWQGIKDLLTGAAYPTRALRDNLADINAALASLKTGEQKLIEMANEHGLEKVHRYMKILKDYSYAVLDTSLERFNDRKFSATEKLDDGHQISVAIEIKGGHVTFDFEGTSATHPHNLNINPAIVHSAIIYCLRLLCLESVPLNEGLMKRTTINLPEGCFLNPVFSDDASKCPAVAGGNTDVSQRLVDTLLKTTKVVACSQGTMNNFLFGNDGFGYYETICGGVGAGEGFDGASAVHQHMTNTRITDAEEFELKYPVRLWEFSVRKDSGGDGEWKGGNGVIREVEFLEDVELTVVTQHRVEEPYGIRGGKPGKVGEQRVVRRDGSVEKLQGVDSRQMHAGDRVVMETPGGGGYGEV